MVCSFAVSSASVISCHQARGHKQVTSPSTNSLRGLREVCSTYIHTHTHTHTHTQTHTHIHTYTHNKRTFPARRPAVCLPTSHWTILNVQRESSFWTLLVQIHSIMVMFGWTGLAPWEFECSFPGRLNSMFTVTHRRHRPESGPSARSNPSGKCSQ